MKNKIAVLIVTYNRIEKLKKCLRSYSEQTYKPSLIFIVDNNSNDGTKEYIKKWRESEEDFEKHILLLKENMGGSGGFYEGMKAVMQFDFDWLWISDDDAYPKDDAFSILDKSINKYQCDVVCSSVHTEEGIDQAHRKIITKENYNKFGEPAPIELYDKDFFSISVFSFVGSCLKRSVLKNCGLPMKDYFIWFDDTEYSLRVNSHSKIICVPSIEVYHDTIIEKEWKYSWKTYYGERNKLQTMKLHMSKKKFLWYEIHYFVGMIKHFFTDYDYFVSQWAGFIDFKKGISGLSKKHLPGKKPKLKKH